MSKCVFRQLLKRQTSGEPSVDGVHEFHDGYYRGRIYYPGGGSKVSGRYLCVCVCVCVCVFFHDLR